MAYIMTSVVSNHAYLGSMSHAFLYGHVTALPEKVGVLRPGNFLPIHIPGPFGQLFPNHFVFRPVQQNVRIRVGVSLGEMSSILRA